MGLKQLMMRWKHNNGIGSYHYSYSKLCNTIDPPNSKHPYLPRGCVFIHVGPQCERFTVPVRFLNLPIFQDLFEKAAEEFGLDEGIMGLVHIPCEVAFFEEIIKHLNKDEHKYGNFSLEDFANMVSCA
ncbi:auxin-induced protein 15A-like [Lotus japonicus]|uniref:auxin-induced protein 15A-like n=1 Tax=Lotus japonicus TaxID=34305 RepID=UPI002588C46A|nr:auxin-induced protein 15A-like [Lotus japonicus]